MALVAVIGLLRLIESLDCEISEFVGGFRLKSFCRVNMFSRACIPFLCVFNIVFNGRDIHKGRGEEQVYHEAYGLRADATCPFVGIRG